MPPTLVAPTPELSRLAELSPAALGELAATVQSADLADAIARLSPAAAADSRVAARYAGTATERI